MTRTAKDLQGSKIHPGSGRRKAPAFPKGRVLDPTDVERIRELLGDRPRRRDLLIEYLHLVQDNEGCLPAGLLQALAGELRISMAEVYEVASFYAHFDIVRDGDARPATVTIRVCDSLTCAMMGGDDLHKALQAGMDPSQVRVVRAPCMGRCDAAPVCEVGHRHVDHATQLSVSDVVQAGDHHARIPGYCGFDRYLAEGGYSLLKACIAGDRTVEEVIGILSDADLRGLGGAGFPAGRKWQIVRGFDGPRLMTVNGDEGEPGTFKDRYWLERDPHRFLEGTVIAAWAVAAERCYIYIRDEYPAVLQILNKEIARLDAAGLTAHCPLEIRRGAGAYICGEESAMIESIEGKRGLPRHRPPYIAEVGVFG